MKRPLRVGIIWVSADVSWARDAHVPAVQRISGLTLTAVASSSQTRAAAAAEAFGVDGAFGSGLELIRDPGIDLVAICVRVPDHYYQVMAAIAVGKHIYCESPLGRTRAETEEMAASAQRARIRTAIGSQTLANPAVIEARHLILCGTIGRVLTAHVYSSTASFGPVVPTPYLYLKHLKMAQIQ